MADKYAQMVATIKETSQKFPLNLMAKHFDPEYLYSLDDDKKKRFTEIIHSGYANPDSTVGCYAMHVDDYQNYKPFFSKVIYDYHRVKPGVKHVSSWDLETLGLDKKHNFDLKEFGLEPVSMRVRVARNFKTFPLPCHMSKEDRVNLENVMFKIFEDLKTIPEYGGEYYSLTPGHPNFMDDEKYKELVENHFMFKDSRTDPHMNSVGMGNDWPYGRGCYIAGNKDFIIWVGEEDHLRLMSMYKGTILNQPFRRLRAGLDFILAQERFNLQFAFSEDYGTITSCPSNLGTSMRASIHMKLPALAEKGESYIKEIAGPIGLSVRGVHGENTPLGEGGVCDISLKARFCISEVRILQKLYKGIGVLAEKEREAYKSRSSKSSL